MDAFVFQAWMRRPTEALMALNPNDQDQIYLNEFQIMEETGGKSIAICTTNGVGDGWTTFGVNRFPDFAGWMQFQDRLRGIHWRRYMETRSYLGSEMQATEYNIPPAPAGEVPVFKLFRVRMTEAFYALSPDLRNDLFAQVAKRMESAQGKSIVLAQSSWSTEDWPYFGLEYYPNIDCVKEYDRMLVEMDWFRYIESRTLLGTMAMENDLR